MKTCISHTSFQGKAIDEVLSYAPFYLFRPRKNAVGGAAVVCAGDLQVIFNFKARRNKRNNILISITERATNRNFANHCCQFTMIF